MQTQTQTKSITSNVNLMDLPLMKHFNDSDLTTQATNKFRKGEWGLFSTLKLLVIGAIGYGTIVYGLPAAFTKFGEALGLIATGLFCVFLIMARGTIIKWLRQLARNLHKSLIKNDPFAELERQRQKMVQNQQVFRISKGNIKNLENDMQVEAKNSETEAASLQTRIMSLQTKCQNLTSKLESIVKTTGAEGRNSDEYVNGNAELMKMLSESQRVTHRLKQAKDFVQKYGSRAAIMKKMSQKLVLVETGMEIKIADFDATIEMLKKDYEFSQKSRAATDAAKQAMMFENDWEFDFAISTITDVISRDVSLTSGNLMDINKLTENYNVDSDDLYANLNLLADNIKVGKDLVPSAKQYNNLDYQLSSDDKLKSGLTTSLFD